MPALCFVSSVAGQRQESLFEPCTDDFEIAQLDSMLEEGRQEGLRLLRKDFKCVPHEMEGRSSDKRTQLLESHVWGVEADVLAADVALDLIRRAVGDNLPLVDDDDAPGQGISFFQVVGGQDD